MTTDEKKAIKKQRMPVSKTHMQNIKGIKSHILNPIYYPWLEFKYTKIMVENKLWILKLCKSYQNEWTSYILNYYGSSFSVKHLKKKHTKKKVSISKTKCLLSSKSAENLFTIRPTGVASKNDIGQYRICLNPVSCRLLDALNVAFGLKTKCELKNMLMWHIDNNFSKTFIRKHPSMNIKYFSIWGKTN